MSLARRLLILPAIALLAVGTLTACATANSTPGAGSTSDAPGTTTPPPGEVDAAWLDGGRMIGLVTMGSSTCVPMAEDATLGADGSLTVRLAAVQPDKPCTADFVPRVTLVDVPEGVDPTKDLDITVTGDDLSGHTDLDGAPGLAGGGTTEYLPSAGWTDKDGQFVIVTWGSSSCPPVIADVAASGPSEVTVTYQTPPADQVCTMDMAPRAAVVTVDGLQSEHDVTLVLTGTPEFDNVRVPIYGDN